METIQRHGITANGCFILGPDGDGLESFENVFRFVETSGLYDVQITCLPPFPGTPLWARLTATIFARPPATAELTEFHHGAMLIL